jgi:hypothetical protein
MAVAHVQTIKSIDNDANTSQTTNSITVTGGNLVLCMVAQFRSAAVPNAPTSVQLDGSTAFTHDLTQQETDTGRAVSLFSLANVAGGAHTVSITFDFAPNQVATYLMEVSGAATASYQDGVGVGADFTGATTTPETGAFVAGQTTDYWVSALVSSAAINPSTVTAGSGWAIPTNGSEVDGTANCVSGVEYIANPGTATQNGQWTQTSARAAVLVFAYKVAGGGGGLTLPWQPRHTTIIGPSGLVLPGGMTPPSKV